MPLANPDQTTTDLSRQVPPGWSVSGLSAPKFDGVNFYREAGPVGEIRFSTSGPRYMQFQYQLFSPNSPVQGRLVLDGQLLGNYTFPAGQFVTVLPGSFIGAGKHILRSEQSCRFACPINQYFAQVKLAAVLPGSRSAGLGASRWLLDAPQPDFSVKGLSATQFDGVNYFRALNSLQPVTFTFPAKIRPTDFYYMTFSNSAAYQLNWSLDNGSSVTPRLVLGNKTPDPVFLPSQKYFGRTLALFRTYPLQKLQLQVSCQDGTASCLPIRFYWTELTVIPLRGGLSTLSAPGLLSALALTLALLLLFALLLRPAPARR